MSIDYIYRCDECGKREADAVVESSKRWRRGFAFGEPGTHDVGSMLDACSAACAAKLLRRQAEELERAAEVAPKANTQV
jgi:hypothetical protein